MEKIIVTTKYTKTIGIFLIAMVFSIAILPTTSFAEVQLGTTNDSLQFGTTNDSLQLGTTNDSLQLGTTNDSLQLGTTNDSLQFGNTNNSLQWDYPSQQVGVNYGYGYGYGYNYPVNSNYIGVGLVAPIVGYQPNNSYVFPTTPNYVTPTLTVVSPTYTQPTYVQPTYYNTQPVTSTYVPNQVLAFNDTNPSLDSVYLSDVPYTGFSDYYGIIIFISILLSWSAILAYLFLKRKISEKMSLVSVYANKSENVDDSMKSDFVNQIASDKSDIKEVEDYARMKKVLLSTDASAKLVKIQRLHEGNAKDIIDSLSGNEWIAIGEGDL